MSQLLRVIKGHGYTRMLPFYIVSTEIHSGTNIFPKYFIIVFLVTSHNQMFSWS